MPRGKYPLKHGIPNGATRRAPRGTAQSAGLTRGTETSQYPEEKKTTVIAQVVASERAAAQTGSVKAPPGLKDRQQQTATVQPKHLEKCAAAGESPVGERRVAIQDGT